MAFACVAGFARALSLSHDVPRLATIGLIAVAITAGAGLLLRSDLCAYLAAMTNVMFFVGCLILVYLSIYDLGQPLPVRQHNTDDTPELEAIRRLGAVAGSLFSVLASTFLVFVAYISIRRLFRLAPNRVARQVSPPNPHTM